MAFPDFYDPQRVGQLVVPQTARAVDAGYALNSESSYTDEKRTLLLLVDTQIDFIHEDGALSVPGAVADTRRTIEWLYRHVENITHIAASLDSHVPRQIFFPTWWVNARGKHPEPYTAITTQDVDKGIWRPLFEIDWSIDYVHQLENQAKKVLMIWPYHTLIGTPGHALTPSLYEAIAYHTAARQAQPIFLQKGSIPKTEHYSIMEPEVKVPAEPSGDLNVQFLDLLGEYDRIYVAGQAKSHCVLETVTSMMRYFGDQPRIIEKIHLLEDCTSSVAHPEIDFEKIAQEVLAEYAETGLNLVQSTDDVAFES